MTALSHDPLWPRAGSWPAYRPGQVVDAALVGVPTWRTSLSPTGAHATPTAVRAALARYSATLLAPGPIDLTETLRIADAGDVLEPDGAAGEARVRTRVAQLSASADLVIALGGDNAATYSTAQGVGADALITLDAHFDLRDGVSNGSPVRRLIDDGLDGRRIVQIGIADFANSVAYARRAAAHGITVITLDDIRRRGLDDVIAQARSVVAGGRVHVDVDVDVCDRAVAPGCPASVPGGLAAWELRTLVRALAATPDVVGADICEVDSTADTPDGRTVRLAALCVLELLAGLASRTPEEAP